MIKPVVHGVDATRYGSERSGTAGAVAALALGWVLALGAVAGAASVLAELGWSQALITAALCSSLPFAMWMTRRVIASRRLRAIVPPSVLDQRYHGNLEVITDSEHRPLRPIGVTAREVASRTGSLLADLTAYPSVRIFHNVRPAGASLTSIPHAISAGRKLILIESVAWPAGCYEAAANGHVHCDGTYIGQSVRPLIASVRHWQELLPKNHEVRAMIVVHAAAGCTVRLPAPTANLSWVLADGAMRDLRQEIQHGHQTVSRNAVAALIAATPGLV